MRKGGDVGGHDKGPTAASWPTLTCYNTLVWEKTFVVGASNLQARDRNGMSDKLCRRLLFALPADRTNSSHGVRGPKRDHTQRPPQLVATL